MAINIEDHFEWVNLIANKLLLKLPESFDRDDMRQVGYIALWKASEKYDEARGVPFRGFAYLYVVNAMRMACRRRNWIEATHDELADVSHASFEYDPELMAMAERRWRDAL